MLPRHGRLDGQLRPGWLLSALAASAVLALTALPRASAAPTPAPSARQAARPNIILVLTDDLDRNLGTLDYLPGLKAQLNDQGLTFDDMFVSESLCCPSRSSIQRGEYVHNHQVLGNTPPDGGFERFHALNEDQSTLGTWLQAAGYRTGLMGKYLNGYPDSAAPTYVPPGWEEWDSPAAGNPYGEYNYTLNEDGQLVRYGGQPADYLTDVLAGKADQFVRQAAADNRPYFLYLATYAPHQPATPAPRYADALPDVQAPRPPAYNEPDVSDKPAWVQAHRALGPAQQSQLDALYRRRLQSMLAVQDLVDQLVATLGATGQLDHTYLFFTSDNGFHLGEHRLHAGKLTGYEEDIHVPLIVRGPGVPAGQHRDELVGNVDLGPTFAELAGADLPGFVDGRSLVPLLHDTLPPAAGWRGAFLVEQEEVHFAGTPSPTAVAEPGLLEPLDPFEQAMANAPNRSAQGIPAYAGLRTPTLAYIVYSTGERELYDLQRDPYELQNQITTADPALLTQLDAWLQLYRQCQGAGCRTADLAPPQAQVP